MRSRSSRLAAAEIAQGTVDVDWYTYAVTFSNLATESSQTSSINIEADSDFQIMKTTAFAAIDLEAAPAVGIIQASVMLTDTGSGRNLMNQAIPIPSLFGTGELPFILPEYKLLFARSVLAVTVTNLSANAQYQTLTLNFIGRKVFRDGH